MKITEITATRMDGCEIDASASIRIKHTDNLDVLKALENCLTEWFTTTDEGRAAWEYSYADFNIGDLRAGMTPPASLQKKHGFLILPDDVDNIIQIDFDRVLGDGDPASAEEEEGDNDA